MSAQKAKGLTTDDLASLAAGLAAGKRVSVYLREPMSSLGLDAGTSARVVAVAGSTVTVRPKGVDDELPFEADELLKSRPGTKTAAPVHREPARAATSRVTTPTAAAPKPAAAPGARADAAPATPESPKPAPAKTAPRRGKTSPAAVSVTVTSTGTNTWTVSVLHGTRRQGKPAVVTADRVAQAMRELGDDAAINAVDAVINSARESAQRRIAELSQELEDAKAALADLSGSDCAQRGNV
ncbi:DUF6319 family protein [Gordonia sp. CPCC 205515]|uniref:DUF6319 family protein n=1 Tax=Gordonia sp. CPCC 205515 TaxID=3140791 RepID=UPI003AF3DADE